METKNSPARLKVSGRDCQFMYSVRVSYIFGTAETKDETADRAEEEQHKTKTNTMAKCFGQLNGLLDEQKNDTIVTQRDEFYIYSTGKASIFFQWHSKIELHHSVFTIIMLVCFV